MTQPLLMCGCSSNSEWKNLKRCDRCSTQHGIDIASLSPGLLGLSSDFIDLYESQANADVTFVLADGEIQAHKLVLVTRVRYFQRMFSSGMKEALTNRIEVPDAETEDFDSFLRFIYGGQFPDDFDVEIQLLFARKYDVPGLVPQCIPQLKKDFAQMEDFTSCLSKIKMRNFEIGVSDAARMMERYKFPAVNATIVQELRTRIVAGRYRFEDKYSCPGCKGKSPLLKCATETDEMRERFAVLIVDILILSHLGGCTKLKEKCLQCFATVDRNGRWAQAPFTGAAEKLKEYPDLLLEMVLRYRSGNQ